MSFSFSLYRSDELTSHVMSLHLFIKIEVVKIDRVQQIKRYYHEIIADGISNTIPRTYGKHNNYKSFVNSWL